MIDLVKVKKKLEDYGVIFDSGLTDQEVIDVERRYGFKFPSDLKLLLQYSLPIGIPGQIRKSFPNWRDKNDPYLKNYWREHIIDGINFDIEYNSFWLKELGSKPYDINSAKKIMSEFIDTVPKMIPLHSHRYIPAEPNEDGNPVFSIYQTDIIYYGVNLAEYFDVEFALNEGTTIYTGPHEKPKQIRFWSDMVERMNDIIA